MEQRKATVIEFKNKNKNLSQLCKIFKISRSCIYIKEKISIVRSPGRPAPGFTINRDGEIIDVTASMVRFTITEEYMDH